MSTDPHDAPAVRHGDASAGVAGSPGGSNTAEGVLNAAYWKLREHASAYRGTKAFRLAREQWEASDRSDHRLYAKTIVHEFFAQGIEAAARDIAEMMGVPEHEIEPGRRM